MGAALHAHRAGVGPMDCTHVLPDGFLRLPVDPQEGENVLFPGTGVFQQGSDNCVHLVSSWFYLMIL